MILGTLVLATFSVSLAHSLEPKDEFTKFKISYGKIYATREEEERRFDLFSDNLKKIEKHNSEGHSWRMGITKFADLSKEEFKSRYASGFRGPMMPRTNFTRAGFDIRLEDLPASVDWREQGVINSVRDQGMCGSCWAFAAAGAMEAYAKIDDMDRDLLELSPQHLTSCTPNPLRCGGTGGCMGAVPPLAYTYASLFGVVTEEEYPYTSGDPWGQGDDEKCMFDATQTPVSLMTMGWETLPHNDMLATMNHLAFKGPLATSVAAGDWGLYFGGVFDGCDYDQNIAVNHAVLLVGYGTDPTDGDYWLIKNSWGDMWGDIMTDDAGYMKLRRRSDPMCGTNSSPLDGAACQDGGVDSVHVCGTCGVISDNSYPIGVHYTK